MDNSYSEDEGMGPDLQPAQPVNSQQGYEPASILATSSSGGRMSLPVGIKVKTGKWMKPTRVPGLLVLQVYTADPHLLPKGEDLERWLGILNSPAAPTRYLAGAWDLWPVSSFDSNLHGNQAI